VLQVLLTDTQIKERARLRDLQNLTTIRNRVNELGVSEPRRSGRAWTA
jgi:preprotein translocase subunit SecD